MPITAFATTDEEVTDQDNEKKDNDNDAASIQDTKSQEVETNTDNQTIEQQRQTSEPIPPAIAAGEPNPSPDQTPQCMVESCPGQAEVCDDGLDNDGDSITDEFLCVSNNIIRPGQEEVCDDGLDNNADGFIDEDCPPNQLPQESGPTLPDVGAGKPPPLPGEQGGGSIMQGTLGGAITDEHGGPDLQAIEDPEVSTILLPQKCVSYELFKPRNPMEDPAVQAMTCAKIVKYTDTNQTVAFVEQWFNGNKVYDSAFPKSPDFPCGYCDEEIVGTVGNYQVKLYLELWPDYTKLNLRSATKIYPTNIKETDFGRDLFVWQSPTPTPEILQPQWQPYNPGK